MGDLKLKWSVENYEKLINLLEQAVIENDREWYLIHTRKWVFQIKRLPKSIYPTNKDRKDETI